MEDDKGGAENLDKCGGLTRRELFAAMAMQGLLAGTRRDYYTSPDIVKDSCACADALIAELDKGEEK